MPFEKWWEENKEDTTTQQEKLVELMEMILQFMEEKHKPFVKAYVQAYSMKFKECWQAAQKELIGIDDKAQVINKRTLESEQKLLERERKSARKELAQEIMNHLQSNEFHTADPKLVKFLEKEGAD